MEPVRAMTPPRAPRAIDRVEAVFAVLWPRRMRGATGWLFLAPALLVVGVLAIGLGYIVEYSLHELDIATYRLREAYSLGNYETLIDRPVYRAGALAQPRRLGAGDGRSRSRWPSPTPMR
jgi:putative spermidine/putrescine transport system permease protein